jgi:flagellar motor component MotA
MKYQFSICRTLSSFFIVFLLVFTIYIGGGGYAFIHIPSFIITGGLAFFITLAVYELEFLKFIINALRLFVCKPTEPNPRFAQIALFASRSIIGAGVIAMIIGLVQMLQHLSDPSQIGAGMAVALLSPFYGILISEICLVVIYQSFKDIQTKQENNKTLPIINAGLPLLAILFTICVFMTLLISFSEFKTGSGF